eukprot:TRINITY_DN3130_c0_g1_i1.p1 TRINITY_DN3130_c0_g1~~TRINITY_DN3130_c0_g1_i1.p1  ORF type:complete len:720 (+),score=125.38 TRINITY_DN3130_c0_g1_i1:1064-3223(+)
MSTELILAMSRTVSNCLENGKPGPSKVTLNELLYDRCNRKKGKTYASMIKRVADELQKGVEEATKRHSNKNVEPVIGLVNSITQDRRSLLPHREYIIQSIVDANNNNNNDDDVNPDSEAPGISPEPNLLSLAAPDHEGSHFHLSPLSPEEDRSEFLKIKRFVEETNVHNLSLRVVAIEKVFNAELERDYQKLRSGLHDKDPTATEYSFHGTAAHNVMSIVEHGFHGPLHPSLLYGMGIYFASNSSKCVWFVEPWDIDALQSITEPYTWPGAPQQLIVAELAVGNYKEVQSPTPHETQETLHRDGFDSVKAIANSQHKSGCRYEEWVVYNPKQAFPRYVVHYQKTHMPLDSEDPTFDVATNKWIDKKKSTQKQNEERYPVGLVIGKFMPLHSGHVALIETAKAESQKVIIIVCDNGTKNCIPGRKRVRLIKDLFPSNREQIVLRLDMPSHNLPPECTTEDEWERWSAALHHICKDQGFGAPNCIFGGENYVTLLSKHMNISNRVVPRNDSSQTVVAAATDIRQHPISMFEKMPISSQQAMTHKIVLFGSESVGKTTMAQMLAEKYGCSWVPEGARRILGSTQVSSIDQMELIAAEQLRSEDHICAYNTSPLLFCDTDLVVTTVYADHYFPDQCPDWIKEAAAHRQYSLYLFLSCEVPWVPDPLRDLSGDLRPVMEAKFLAALSKKTDAHPTTKVVHITGSDWNSRFNQAVTAVDSFMSSL